MHKARRVNVREFGTAKLVHCLQYIRVMGSGRVQYSQIGEVREELPKRACMFLTHSVQEPRVRFGHHKHRRAPSGCRTAEQRDRLLVPAIPPAHQRDKDSAVNEHRGAHGASRPYTTSSTDALSLGVPSTTPAYVIHGLSLGSLAIVSSRLRRQSSANEIPRRCASNLALRYRTSSTEICVRITLS